MLQTAVRVVESPSPLLVIVSLFSARQERQDRVTRVSVECEIPVVKSLPGALSSGRGFDTDCPTVLTASASPDTAAFIRCHRHSISQYHNIKNKSISQFQECLLRYHARV